MDFITEDTRRCVLKGVPPDKSVGAWPSVQEKITGTGNVGKSPGGGTNDNHSGLKVHEETAPSLRNGDEAATAVDG